MSRRLGSEIVILLALMGLALALRLWRLGEESLWIDEANAFAQSAGTWADVLRISRQEPLDFPLERWILHPLTTYPPNEFLFRLPAALWGVLGVALTYALARQIWDKETALLAAGLLALSPYHIRYSQEARNYTSFLALHLLTLLALVRAVRRRGRADWILYALAAGIALYDHLYSLIVLAWQWGLHALLALVNTRRQEPIGGIGRQTLRAHSLALLGAGALLLPWAIYVAGGPFLQELGTSSGLFHAPGTLRLEPDLFLRMLCWFTANRGEAVPTAWIALVGMAGACALPARPARRLAWLTTIYMAGVFLTVAVLSRLSGTYLAYRRLLFLQPLLFLLTAGGYLALARWAWRRITRRPLSAGKVLLPALLILAAGLAWTPALRDHYRSEKENWRAVAQVLKNEAGERDWVVNCADSANAWQALRVYLGPRARTLHLLTPAQAVQRLGSTSRRPARIWYILPIPVNEGAGQGWQFNDPRHLRPLDGDRSLPPHALMLSLERWEVPAKDPQFLTQSLLEALARTYSTSLPIPLDWRFNALNAWASYHDAQGDWAPALRAYQTVMAVPAVPAAIRENLAGLTGYLAWRLEHAGEVVPGSYWDAPRFGEALRAYVRQQGMSVERADQLMQWTLALEAEMGEELPAGSQVWRFERPEDLGAWDIRLAGASAHIAPGAECGGGWAGCLRIETQGAGYHGSLERRVHLEPGRAYLLRCRMRTASTLALQGKVLYVSYRQAWRRPGAYASAFWGSAGWQTFVALFVPLAGVSEITLAPVLVDHAGALWIAEVSVIPLSP